jgi:hypothetical protein
MTVLGKGDVPLTSVPTTGYAGDVVVDLGHGQRLTVNMWDSEQDATAALSTLGREVGRVLTPVLSTPSQLIGTGRATTDLAICTR